MFLYSLFVDITPKVIYNTDTMNEDKIIQKLEQHDQKFLQHDKQFDIVISKLMEYDEKFEAIDEKLSRLREETLHGQDAMMTILKRLDEERVFNGKRLKDVEGKTETNTQDIQQIKTQLKLA